MVLKANDYFPDLSSKEIFFYTFIKFIIVLLGRKIEKNSLVNGVGDLEANCNYIRNKTNEDI